ncbi:hypothetical protein JVT61DRAFT_10381 [Boletus reticuloceps]|uniref:Uncharacterized protein n=1 Tax=Boletus reticuloceps TaxID=495285 RepID=A0A8I3ADV9_9AGAM|nr:hypothetical protein JVT61DRAFT_10381 [Boletus reticuloceps]
MSSHHLRHLWGILCPCSLNDYVVPTVLGVLGVVFTVLVVLVVNMVPGTPFLPNIHDVPINLSTLTVFFRYSQCPPVSINVDMIPAASTVVPQPPTVSSSCLTPFLPFLWSAVAALVIIVHVLPFGHTLDVLAVDPLLSA